MVGRPQEGWTSFFLLAPTQPTRRPAHRTGPDAPRRAAPDGLPFQPLQPLASSGAAAAAAEGEGAGLAPGDVLG